MPPYVVVTDVVLAALAVTVVLRAPWYEVGLATAAVVATLAAQGTYRSRLALSALDGIPAITVASMVGAFVSVCFQLATPGVVRVQHLLVALVLAVALLAGHAAVYAGVRAARRRGLISHRTLVLGAGEVGREVARMTLEHPEYGLKAVGFLDAGPVADPEELPVPLLGNYHQLRHFVRRERASEVIVAFLDELTPTGATGPHDVDMVDVVRECDRLDCEIFSVPRFHELRHLSADMDELWGIPLIRARRSTWRSVTWTLKRCLDVLFSLVVLAILSPVLLLIALAVRIELGPGVLFRQVRVGLDGEFFTLLKFRSLPRQQVGGRATPWSVADDARLGRVGRFIRATSLDELPQLLNVLRGEMSLVGPRPERPEYVERFTKAIPRYTARHRTPAGLTGLAQVNGLRGDTSIEERARFDNQYIQNWSLWLDAKILARTVSAVLLRRGS